MNLSEVCRTIKFAMTQAALASAHQTVTIDDAWATGLIPEKIKPPQWIGAAVSALVGSKWLKEVTATRSKRKSRNRSKIGVFVLLDRDAAQKFVERNRHKFPLRNRDPRLFDPHGDDA